MNCKEHPDQPAIAFCMGCGAGLCSSCGSRMTTGKHCCSPACALIIETQHKAFSELITKSRVGYKLLPILTLSLGVFFPFLGLSSLLVGRFSRVDFMTVVIGILFIGFGIYAKKALPPAS